MILERFNWSQKRKKVGKTAAILLLVIVIFTGCGGLPEKMDFMVNMDGIETADISAGVSVHDPTLTVSDGTYYLFGTHMTAAKSEDLRNWTAIGNGYSPNNKVYTDLKNYDSGEFAYTGSKASVIPTEDGEFHIWAPDIIYNKAQKLYYMYYCTSSTFYASNLCYATSKQIDGPYEWKSALIYSGFTTNTIDKTDVLDYVDRETAIKNYTRKAGYEYNYENWPNALDPCVLYGKDGKLWMVYGSWSGGIYLLELDEETGEVIHPKSDEENDVDPYFGKRLLGGGHTSIEGPFLLYDEESDYYYLYVSYGELKREGGYQIRVFRSKNIDGPYEDMNGKHPGKKEAHVYFGLKLSGNYILPSLEKAYMATGHNSALIDEDGKRYIAYHTRFDDGSEYFEPRIKQYFLNEEAWPCMLPYATHGETISDSGYEMTELCGRYYVINQGKKIDSEIAEPFIWYLKKDGTISGEDLSGSWEITDGTCYVHLSFDDQDYSGVFCRMEDEAGTEVMVFTAVGGNESVWGVSYPNSNGTE